MTPHKKASKAIAASVLGLTLGLSAVACGNNDNNSNTSSRGDQKIDLPKEYDLSKRKGSTDFSPFSVALNAEKVADIPGLSSTRGLQIIDGKLFGHTLVNKDNGASKVFSTSLDGSDYETVKELGPISESPDAKYAFDDEEVSFNPETFGLSIAQENKDTKPALFALRGGALPNNGESSVRGNRISGEVVTLGDSSVIKEAQKKFEDRVRKDYALSNPSTQHFSYQSPEYSNSCVYTPLLGSDNVTVPTLNTNAGGSLSYNNISKDEMWPNDPKGNINQWIDPGSTSRYKKEHELQKTTSCAFSDHYLATNIRQHVTFGLSNKPLNKIAKNGAENAKVALSLPEKEGKEDSRDITHMISINGLPNNEADVTAVVVDPNNPDNLYFSIEGSDNLYKLDLSPIKDDSKDSDEFSSNIMRKLPDGFNQDLK